MFVCLLMSVSLKSLAVEERQISSVWCALMYCIIGTEWKAQSSVIIAPRTCLADYLVETFPYFPVTFQYCWACK